jgi:formamidopyrimidine-DNA glycosylase
MPEVIEVKKYADFIKIYLLGKRVTEIKIHAGRYKKHGPFAGYKELVKKLPLTVINVGTKGKLLWIEFNNNVTLCFTLGLSGGFFYKTDKQLRFPKIFSENDKIIDIKEKYDIIKFQNSSYKHMRLSLKINTGIIGFYDAMSYGTISVYTNLNDFKKRLSTLGPDIMNVRTSLSEFKERILLDNNLNKPIGNVLVNQKIISGIGNYLRADLLWLAKISPFRLVKNLKDSEIKKIYEATRHLIWSDYNKKRGIKLGIVSKRFKSPEDYDRLFLVYQQDKDPQGRKVSRKLLHEGSQKRIIHYVKGYQV